MILKRLVRSFLKGVRRVNQKALHAGKSKSLPKAKPVAVKARSVASKAKHVKKAASKVKSKVHASVKAKAQAAQLKAKAKTKAKSSEPEFKRTSVNPLAAMPMDPAHSPGHRKMNWKKYQETAKMSRKAVRP